MLKIKPWFVAFFLAIAACSIFFLQSFAASAKTVDTIADIPTPKVEKPSLILTPAIEIFNIASCSTKDMGFSLASAKIPPGGGPMPHVHYFINEWFWTPEGGIELYSSAREYPDIKQPPTQDGAGKTDLYMINMQPRQVVYSPKHHVHGFVNSTTKTLPITFVWLKDKVAPDFPFNDGGMREYFTDSGVKITDLDNLPQVTDASRAAFVNLAPEHGINQSSYFLQYVSTISDQIPDELAKLKNDRDLKKIVQAIKAFNRGDKSVSCS